MKKFLISLIILCFVIVGCSNDDSTDTENNEGNEEEASAEKETEEDASEGEEEGNIGVYTTKEFALGEPVVQDSTIGEFEITIHSVEKIELPSDFQDFAFGLAFDTTVEAIEPDNGEYTMDDFLDAELVTPNESETEKAGINQTWGLPELAAIPEEPLTEGTPARGKMIMAVFEEMEDYQLVFGTGLEAATDKLILNFSKQDIK